MSSPDESELSTSSGFERGSQISPQSTLMIESESHKKLEDSSKKMTDNTSNEKVSKTDCNDSDNDSNPENHTKCPICFVSLVGKEVSTPDACNHYFCCPCLKQWSNNVTTCPVDRLPFKSLLVKDSVGGQVIRAEAVKEITEFSPSDIDEDPTFCQVCRGTDREHRMLLCDQCNSGYHLECLTPPLASVPPGDWYCPYCRLAPNETSDDPERPPRTPRTSLLPRPLGIISFENTNGSRRNTRSSSQPSIFIPDQQGLFSRSIRQTQSSSRFSTNPFEDSSDEDSSEHTAPRARSRRARNRGNVSHHRPSSSHVSSASNTLNRQRISVGIPRLHLFGHDSLDCFSDGSDGEMRNDSDNTDVAQRSRVSPSTARQLAARKLAQDSSRANSNLPFATSLSNSYEILKSIMENQELWLSKDTTKTVNRDGSITITRNSHAPNRVSETIQNTSGGANSSTVSKENPYHDVLGHPSHSIWSNQMQNLSIAHRSSDSFSIHNNEMCSTSYQPRPENSILPWHPDANNRVGVSTLTSVVQAPLHPDGSSNTETSGSSYHYSKDNEYGRTSSSYQYSGHLNSHPELSSSSTDRGHGAAYMGYLEADDPISLLNRLNIVPEDDTTKSQSPSASQGVSTVTESQLEESKFADVTEPSSQNHSHERDPKKNDLNKVPEVNEIDFYSNIVSSGFGKPSFALGHADNECCVDVLPPPPEPPALLRGLGEQDSSYSERVDCKSIDIQSDPDVSMRQQNDYVMKSPDESEKYDPAIPCDDSDDELPLSHGQTQEEIPLPLSSSVSCKPMSKIRYLHSPSYLHSTTYGELGENYFAQISEAVTDAVNEISQSRPQSSSVSNSLNQASGDYIGSHGYRECPNFSIYSANNMHIANKTIEISEHNSDNLLNVADKAATLKQGTNKIKSIDRNELPSLFVEEICESKGYGNKDYDEHELEEAPCYNNSNLESHFVGTNDSVESLCAPNVFIEPLSTTFLCTNSNSDTASRTDSSVFSPNIFIEDLNKELINVEETKPTTIENVDKLFKEDSNKSNDENIHQENVCKDSNPPHIVMVKDDDLELSHCKDDVALERRSAVSTNNSEGRVIDRAIFSDIAAPTFNISLSPSKSLRNAPPNSEGHDTKIILETEENHFDNLSNDVKKPLSKEDGEMLPKIKKYFENENGNNERVNDTVTEKSNLDKERTLIQISEYEEGEIIDDLPRINENYETISEKANNESEMSETGMSLVNEKFKKKKNVDMSTTLLYSEDDDNSIKSLDSILDASSISWKKTYKKRNYRDRSSIKHREETKKKSTKPSEDTELPKKERKQKEKRKDMERYDVRKIISEKRRKRKDEFGRDLSRDHSSSGSQSCSRSRSKSRRMSRDRSISLSKTDCSYICLSSTRSRKRSRTRSRSTSYRSRSRSKNKSARKSRDRAWESHSKDRHSKSSADRSRRRSRSISAGRKRNRSRSRSVNQRVVKGKSSGAIRQKYRRSWSRDFTPTFSHSRSRSLSYQSYSQSPSPQMRRYNRSFSKSFSRSWSRERHERVPFIDKKTSSSEESQKKLTVCFNNNKNDNGRRHKKDKKNKHSRKLKESPGGDKEKIRKERSPEPSKEVFTSGDNILVSVNFSSKSNKGSGTKDAEATAPAVVTSASTCPIPKDSSKRKQRDENIDSGRDSLKKIKKEKGRKLKISKKADGVTVGTNEAKKGKKSKKFAKRNKRLAGVIQDKPVEIIDLDQLPLCDETQSPRDIVVVSSTDDLPIDKKVASGTTSRVIHEQIVNPQSSLKLPVTTTISETQPPVMSLVNNYLDTSTEPKTPSEPQKSFSIASNPELQSITNELKEDNENVMSGDTMLDDSERQLDSHIHSSSPYKATISPCGTKRPTTSHSSPILPDAYDPFEPTNSGTPTPVREDGNVDDLKSSSGTTNEEPQYSVDVNNSPLLSDLEVKTMKTEVSSDTLGRETCDSLKDDNITLSPDEAKSISVNECNTDVPATEQLKNEVQIENSALEESEKISTISITMEAPTNNNVSSLSLEMEDNPVVVQQKKLPKQPIKSVPMDCNKPFPPTNADSTSVQLLTNISGTVSNIFNTPITVTVSQLSNSHVQDHLSSSIVSQQRTSHFKTFMEKSINVACVGDAPARSIISKNSDEMVKALDTPTDSIDMDLDSPYSPASSEGDDLFEPPPETVKPTAAYPPMNTRSIQIQHTNLKQTSSAAGNTTNKLPGKFEALFGASPAQDKALTEEYKKHNHGLTVKVKGKMSKGPKKEVHIKMDEDELCILDDLPSSAVELQVKDKFLKKLNHQERVVEEVKLALKPFYTNKKINKEEYKEILRKAVPKICHNKSGEINPKKISALVEAYVIKFRHERKKLLMQQQQ